MEAKIHFKNEPFMAVVQGKGEKPIQCTPVVYDEPYNFGLAVNFENGGGQIWGLICPRNMVAVWRGTEVLRLLKNLDKSTLCYAYYTGIRNPHSSDFESYVKPMITKIGQTAYNKIMSMQVPEQIIKAIIDNQNSENSPSLYPITEEVRAGTIKWRQEFTDLKIEHPFAVDALKKKNADTLKKFSKLLYSYAKANNLSAKCLEMNYVAGALLSIIEKNDLKKHPDYVLVALAGVVGHLAVTESTLVLFPSSKSMVENQIERSKKEAIKKASEWLYYGWGSFRFLLIGPRMINFSFEGAKTLLDTLISNHFPLSAES